MARRFPWRDLRHDCEKRWQRHQSGLITHVELVLWFLDAFDDDNPSEDLGLLPAGFLAEVKHFFENERPFKPTGVTIGQIPPELIEKIRLDRKHRYEILAASLGFQVTWSDEGGEFV
jgi:hypothetical protein